MPATKKTLCKRELTHEEVTLFERMISNNWVFSMYSDGLPMFAFVGGYDEEAKQSYLGTHLHFSFLFNEDRIIGANVTTDSSSLVPLDLSGEGMKVTFTYSSQWTPTTLGLKDRPRLLGLNVPQEELEVHWLSIANSASLVVLLTGFIALVLNRTVRRDLSRYSQSAEESEEGKRSPVGTHREMTENTDRLLLGR